MRNPLLLDENPLIVMPGLAVAIGLNESIFVQQLHYWLQKSGKERDGKIWVYNSVTDWNEQFPFWSDSTLRRIIKKLETEGIIETGNFNKLPIDKTKWYRICEETLLKKCDKGIESRKRQTSSQNDHMVRSDCTHGPVNVDRPLPEITTETTTEIEVVDTRTQESVNPSQTAFAFYQENGFGILNPYIGEKMGAWIDDTNEELVIHALKLALENGKCKWNYAEGILRDWERRGLKTVDDVRADAERYRRERGQRGEKGKLRNAEAPGSADGSYNGIKF